VTPEDERMGDAERVVALVSNALAPPRDEGIRNTASTLAGVVRARGGVVVDLDRRGWWGKKLLLGLDLPPRRRSSVVYVPTQSATNGTLLRVALLRLTARPARVVLLAAQLRDPWLVHALPRPLRPHCVLSPSSALARSLESAGWDAAFLPLGVDVDRFTPARPDEVPALRATLGLPANRKLLLHVGHFKEKRNLSWLEAAQRRFRAQVVVVGSTTMYPDRRAADALRTAGVHVVEEFVPDIASYYRACDCYLFPVLDEDAAVGVPLSVLEAMACNIPVVTTPFGGLPGMFDPGNGLYFAATEETWLEEVGRALGDTADPVETRALVLPYRWEEVAERILQAATPGTARGRRRPRVSVAISGPDGAGKTTVCLDVRGLLEAAGVGAYVHWIRPGSSRFLAWVKAPLPRRRPRGDGAAAPAPPAASPRKQLLHRHRVLRSIWAGVVAADFLVRVWTLRLVHRRGVHVYDRFVIDGAIDLAADYGSRLWTRLVLALGPRADIAVLLKVDLAVAAARSETPMPEAYSRVAHPLYARYAGSCDVVLDASATERAVLAERVAAVVLRRYANAGDARTT
jgi:glycosyltransferase involved in cell wall biosynthesis